MKNIIYRKKKEKKSYFWNRRPTESNGTKLGD
jgi:hypothetical protein